MRTQEFKFFRKHAGYSYNLATETPAQGRSRCARNLAAAERAARAGGYSYEWSVDPDMNSSDFQDTDTPYALWRCAMRDPDGITVASLGGIDFGPDGEPWGDPYRRVVEAELAVEAGL